MKKFITRSFIGIFFGAFIAVFTTNVYILVGDFDSIDGSMFLRDSIGSIIFGWLVTIGSLYYDIRKLKLMQQTILHFLTVFILYLILALSIGWMSFTATSIFLAILIAFIVFAAFWIAFYFYFKNQARKLNDDLRKLC